MGRLLLYENAFTDDHVEPAVAFEGQSIQQIVDAHVPLHKQPYLNVYLNTEEMTGEDALVPVENWERVKPKDGASLIVEYGVFHGGGGGGGKNPLRTILSIAIIAAAAFTGNVFGTEFAIALFGSAGPVTAGQVAFASALITGGVTVLGNLALNAVFPPQQPNLDQLGGTQNTSRTSPTLTITGTRNQFNRYGPYIRNFGKNKIFPPYAARPYTEIQGNDQYLRVVFDFGYGPQRVSDLRIGAVPVANFDEVETEIREGFPTDDPITLYTQTIQEDAFNVQITAEDADGFTTVTRANAKEATLDITFRGLVSFDNRGNRNATTVEMLFDYRLNGTSDPFTGLLTEEFTDSNPSTVRRSVRFVFPTAGTYDIRVRRTTADSTSSQLRNDSFLTVVRTIVPEVPFDYDEPHTLVAMRIRATNQLQGVIDQLSGICESMHPILDPNTNTFSATPQVSRNPADHCLEILRGNANGDPQEDSELDLDSWGDFQTACNALNQNNNPRHMNDLVVDYFTTVNELINTILGGARASRTILEDRIGVLVETAGTAVINHFTPSTSWGFKSNKIFGEKTQAVRARYVEPNKNYAQNEIVVFNDGFNADNTDRYEVLEWAGKQRTEEVWALTRYHIAQAELRPEQYTIQTNIRHIRCTRGDVVRVTHDVPKWGLHWGRVTALNTSDPGSGEVIDSVVVDEPVTMVAGTTYGVYFEGEFGQDFGPFTVNTVAGVQTQLTFAASIPVASGPIVGSMFQFGEAGRETVKLIVKSIQPAADQSASIILVDEAPAIQQADSGPIPDFDAQITPTNPYQPEPPLPPVIDNVVSDESVLDRLPNGTFLPKIVVSFTRPAGGPVPNNLVVEFKNSAAQDFLPLPPFPADTTSVEINNVTQGQSYDIRARYVTTAGLTSTNALVTNHMVVGTSTAPPTPQELLVERIPNGGKRYRVLGDEPVDLAGYQFRWVSGEEPNWPAGQPAHAGVNTGGVLEAQAFLDRTFTVMVKAVDVAGNESAEPAFAVVTLGPQLSNRLLTTFDTAAQNFPGTITGGAISNGRIVAGSTGVVYSDPTTFVFTNENNFVIDSRSDMAYSFTWAPPSKGFISIVPTVNAPLYTVEYNVTGTEIVYTDPNAIVFGNANDFVFTGTGTRNYVGTFFIDTGATLNVTIRVPGGNGTADIENVVVQLDAELVEEYVNDVNIGSSGTRIPTVNDYSVIYKVDPILQFQSGGDATRLELVDRNAIDGPLIRAYNTSNNLTTALIDATIVGTPS